MSKLISIVVPHYQGSVSDGEFRRFASSLTMQGRDDLYELLLYHDGPLIGPCSLPAGWKIEATAERQGQWGHHLRQRGIMEATGEWVWILNADSLLYPGAVERVARTLQSDPAVCLWTFPMNECKYDWPKRHLIPARTVEVNHVDATQVLARREVWMKEGGWHDMRYDSDGRLYGAMAQKYPWRSAGGEPILEHW